MDDAILIRRFKETGDRAAFETLLAQYEDKVFRFGLRMCGQREDAEDVLQDTFVSAFRYLKDFRGDASFLSWLLKIASSACIKKRRLRKNEPRTHVPLDEVEPAYPVTTAPDAVSLSPDAMVLSAEEQLRIQIALCSIPPAYREVVILRDIEGLSVKETSEVMAISQGAVKVRLHRARAMLLAALEQAELPDGKGALPATLSPECRQRLRKLLPGD